MLIDINTTYASTLCDDHFLRLTSPDAFTFPGDEVTVVFNFPEPVDLQTVDLVNDDNVYRYVIMYATPTSGLSTEVHYGTNLMESLYV